MDTSLSTPAAIPANARLNELVGRLQLLRSSNLKVNWKAYALVLCYALMAWLTGKDFLTLYLVLVAVVLTFHEISVSRVERQLDCVVEALRRLEKTTAG